MGGGGGGSGVEGSILLLSAKLTGCRTVWKTSSCMSVVL